MVAIAVAVTAILKVPVTALFSTAGSASATSAAFVTATGATVASTTTATFATLGTTGAIAAGATVGAAAAIASQGFGVATGIQDRFSFRSIALAAISGGVAGGLGTLPGLNGSGLATGAARGALSNAAVQGISVATGLQKSFSWTGVAVGGVVNAAGVLAGSALGAPGIANTALSGMAGAIAGAGAKSLLSGTGFGDNIIAVLPDVIGATLVNVIGATLVQRAAQNNGKPDAEIASSQGDPELLAFRAQSALLSRPRYFSNVQMAGDGYGGSDAVPLFGDTNIDSSGSIVVNGKRLSGWEKFTAAIGDLANSPAIVNLTDTLNRASLSLVYGPVQGALRADRGYNAATALQSDLNGLSRGTSRAVNGLYGYYDLGRNAIESSLRGSRFNGAIELAYAPADFVAAGFRTIGNGIAALPSAVAHPIDSVTGLFVGAAQTIDRALVAERTPARLHAARALNALANSSVREIATGAGAIAGNAALIVAPVKGGPALRFEARANAGVEAAWGQRTARMSNVRALGREGELSVGFIGNKERIFVPGTNRVRIPDGVTIDTLSEVKNVATLSYTRQLQDFKAIADEGGQRFDLYIRKNTEISQTLETARLLGEINVIRKIRQ